MQNRDKNDEKHCPSTFTNGAIYLKEHELNKIDSSPSNGKLGGKLPTGTITWLCKELHHL